MIQPFVNDTTNLIGKILNIHEDGPMAMDREIIADSTIFIAKKRYIARVLDTEGVRLKEPKKKVMGLELVRSSTPKFCRKYLKESIDILLDGGENELQDWVSDIKKKFNIDMNETQRNKLIDELPAIDIVITMGCNVDCPYLACRYREDFGLTDPSGENEFVFDLTVDLIDEKIKNLVLRLQTKEVVLV
jgi:DNA polymerase elongation subunit (family B)